MAVLNGLYIWVDTESVDRPVTHTQHPVESGVDITDHVRTEPAVLSVSGKVVGADAENTMNLLRKWQTSGSIVSWVGRSVFLSVQIEGLSASYSRDTSKGYDLTLTLREVRIAASVWKTKQYKGTVKIKERSADGTVQTVNVAKRQQRFHTLRAGETLLFVAGQYKDKGVTSAKLKSQNKTRDVFQKGYTGNFNFLRTGASLLLGVW